MVWQQGLREKFNQGVRRLIPSVTDVLSYWLGPASQVPFTCEHFTKTLRLAGHFRFKKQHWCSL